MKKLIILFITILPTFLYSQREVITSGGLKFRSNLSVKEYSKATNTTPEASLTVLNTFYSTAGGDLVVDTTVNIATNTTLTAKVKMEKGGLFNISNAVTLTINGKFDCSPLQQAFSWTGTGTTSFSKTSLSTFYVEWYGAIPDDLTDDYAAMQKTIDVAEAVGITNIQLSVGEYRLTKGLVIKPNSVGLAGFTFRGSSHRPYDGTKATKIKCTHNDNFAIGIQSGRGVEISNIFFEGPGSSVNPTLKDYITKDDAWFATQWGRISRYSPFAAIVVDPFQNGGAPPDGGYPGFSSEYVGTTNAFSADILIANNVIRYFPVAICLSPTEATGNGSEITIREIHADRCTYGVTVSQTQARSIDLISCRMAAMKVNLDGITFGNQLGPMPQSVACQYGYCRDIFRFSNGGGSGKMTNIYAESVYRLGLWSGNFNPLLMTNCEIAFTTFAESGVQDAASVLDCGLATVTYEGGYLGYSSYRAVDVKVEGLIEFRNTNLKNYVVNTPNTASITANVRYYNCKMDGLNGNEQYRPFNKEMYLINTSVWLNTEGTSRLPRWQPNFLLTYGDEGNNADNEVIITDAEDNIPYVTQAGNETITVDSITATATFTSSTINRGRYRVGDILTITDGPDFGATPSGLAKTSASIGIISAVNMTTGLVTISSVTRGFTSRTVVLYIYETKSIMPTFIGNITAGSNKLVITSKASNRTVAQSFAIGMRLNSTDGAGYNYGIPWGYYVTSVVNDTVFMSGNALNIITGIEVFGAKVNTTYIADNNQHLDIPLSGRRVGYRKGDKIIYPNHPYRIEATITSGGFTPTFRVIHKTLSGSTGSRDALSPTPTSDDIGLKWWNTTTSRWNQWNGSAWTVLADGSATTLTGTGTQNRFTLWGASNTLTDSPRFGVNGQRVGFGTTTNLGGALTISQPSGTEQTKGITIFDSLATNIPKWHIVAGYPNSYDGFLSFLVDNQYVMNMEPVSKTTQFFGNLRINENTSKLGPIQHDNSYIKFTNNSGVYGMEIQAWTELNIKTQSGYENWFKSDGKIGLGLNNPSAKLEVKTATNTATDEAFQITSQNGTNLMWLLTGGKLGLSTSAVPTELLELGGTSAGIKFTSTSNTLSDKTLYHTTKDILRFGPERSIDFRNIRSFTINQDSVYASGTYWDLGSISFMEFGGMKIIMESAGAAHGSYQEYSIPVSYANDWLVAYGFSGTNDTWYFLSSTGTYSRSWGDNFVNRYKLAIKVNNGTVSLRLVNTVTEALDNQIVPTYAPATVTVQFKPSDAVKNFNPITISSTSGTGMTLPTLYAPNVLSGTDGRTIVRNGMSIGDGYKDDTPPNNGLIVQTSLGVGVTSPGESIHTSGLIRSNAATGTGDQVAYFDANGVLRRTNANTSLLGIPNLQSVTNVGYITSRSIRSDSFLHVRNALPSSGLRLQNTDATGNVGRTWEVSSTNEGQFYIQRADLSRPTLKFTGNTSTFNGVGYFGGKLPTGEGTLFAVDSSTSIIPNIQVENKLDAAGGANAWFTAKIAHDGLETAPVYAGTKYETGGFSSVTYVNPGAGFTAIEVGTTNPEGGIKAISIDDSGNIALGQGDSFDPNTDVFPPGLYLTNGVLSSNYVTYTGSVTLSTTTPNFVNIFDGTTLTCTLPTPANNSRRMFYVKFKNAGTITGHIDGTSGASISVLAGQSFLFFCDSTTYWRISN